jgi:uncharacterized protein (TIGR02271 family)
VARAAGPSARGFAPLAINGVGAAAVAGPLSGALGGAGATSDLIASLRQVGFAEPDARHYFESLRRGRALIAVTSPADRIENAVEVMRRLGARAVDDTAFDGGGRVAVEERPPEPPPEPVGQAAEEPPREDVVEPSESVVEQVKVPVLEEQLEVGKRQVSRGGVRINSQIVEEPIEHRITLREERLVVDRRPVYRDATEADLADFKEGTIEIHETIEEPVITKRRRVVEEIVIGRETRERMETISDTVRRTQVRVEQMGSQNRADEEQPAYRYGAALARDERYRGASWDDVEPQARRDWDETAGGWEQFRDAVRAAWQKVSGR